MISGAPVLKVSVEGSTTPTLFLVPSASVMLWLTHLPSKYTLALVATETLSNCSMVMGWPCGGWWMGETLNFNGPRVAISGNRLSHQCPMG